MPVVISVLIFVIYYIIDSGAIRVGKSGEMNPALGTWVSTLVLAPIGAFFTYKSNKDSAVFNIDAYAAFFRKLLGLRESRHLFMKEVIIDTPDYASDANTLERISEACTDYLQNHNLSRLPNYIKLFTNNTPDNHIAEISHSMEAVIENLSNSKDAVIIDRLSHYPILSERAHKNISDKLWINLLIGIIVPVGLVIYLRICRYRRRLGKDLKQIPATSAEIIEQIKKKQLDIID